VLPVPLTAAGRAWPWSADGYWPAKLGRDALKVEWDTSGVEKVDSAAQLKRYRELATQAGMPTERRPTWRRWRAPPKKISAEFSLPLPGARADGAAELHRRPQRRQAALWMGTQMPGVDAAVAAVLGLPPQQVKVDTRWPVAASAAAPCPPATTCARPCMVAKALATPPASRAPVRRCCGAARTTCAAATTAPCTVHRAEIGL
jgi:isoquinoline 1-oxidoreductase beta subunit